MSTCFQRAARSGHDWGEWVIACVKESSASATALLFSSARLGVAGTVSVAARLEKSYWLCPISNRCHGRTSEIRLEFLWQLELQQLIDLPIYNLFHPWHSKNRLPCTIWLHRSVHVQHGLTWNSSMLDFNMSTTQTFGPLACYLACHVRAELLVLKPQSCLYFNIV